MSTERRVSDRRVSLAVTEYAALECERLRDAIREQSRVADAWLNRYSAALGDMDKLRAVNAELRHVLDTIAHSFWEEGEPFQDRLDDVQGQARAALAKVQP